ncbi:transcriptional repressor NF-X1-like [Pecten maximus]|uniref:transcriptional repressor NF-X1-like n=1 Tax=Pecten maximus TaxID=6579 RepID=UPI001457FB63|nr:transcriptional repressor NF-X1-like [Pecten maximus]
MAVACEESYNTLFSSNMNPDHQMYNNHQFHQTQQGYFDPSQLYYPGPAQQFPPSPIFQPFHYAGTPQFFPPSQNHSNNSLGGPQLHFYGQEMNQPVSNNRGRGGRRGGGARGKGRQYNDPQNFPKDRPNKPPKQEAPVVEKSDAVDEYLQSYIDGAFDYDEHVETDSKSKSKQAPNQQRNNSYRHGESKFDRGGNERGANNQRQNYDRENVENNDPRYSYGNRGGRGRGRHEGSRSNYDQDRRSFSSRNRNDNVDRGKDPKTNERRNGGKFDKKVENANESAYHDQNKGDHSGENKKDYRDKYTNERRNGGKFDKKVENANESAYHDQNKGDHSGENKKDYRDKYTNERRNGGKFDKKVENVNESAYHDQNNGDHSGENKKDYRDKYTKPDERQQLNSRRGERSGRGRQSNQGHSFQGRQYDDDYDPQNDNASDNTFKDKNRQMHPNRDKYRMPRTGSRGQGQRYVARTLSGKVDESQRGVLIDQLTNNSYECMVCCETVRCQNAVWNCSNCFHVFHLRCVKKWARSSAAVDESEESGWRCPACQNKCDKFPSQYRCFCGKVRDPDFNRMEIPHSCGEMCSKKRADNCPHPCNILCHPGPCPPCNAVISRSCDCGKTTQTMKCSAMQIIKCEEKCNKQLNCGKHFCKITCHAGSCSMCEEVIVQECYKGHTSREVICGTKASFQSSFSCNSPCQKTLECGNHTCEEICHEGPCSPCSLSPSAVITCPCGATPLTDLSSTPRISCLDPIPTCGAICNKTLNCGPPDNHHICKLPCHEGACGACPGETLLKCRCGTLEKNFPCTEAHNITEENPFHCDKRCNKKRQCGRHKCGQMCCVLEKENHFCDLICGKKLPCGLHKCDEPCHRGNCPPCLLASFEELTCYCGSEVLFPPVPCGARPPECFKKCTRTHTCSHPVRHNCHSDESCPPCTELTQKYCMGKHELRKNIPCHINDISCGLPCDKTLPCGKHKCIRTCHKGECQEDGKSCVQPCTTPRSVCGHPCGVPCHSGQDCPAVPCKAEIIIKCPCGRKTARQFCMAGGLTPELEEYQKITVQTLASTVGSGQSVDISNLTSAAKKVSKRQLECDGECAIMERNRRMALVLEIKNPDLSSKLGNPSYNDFLKEYARTNPQNVASIDKAFSSLVQNAKGSKHPHRSHQFPPMNRDQRRVVHELAEFYGCNTQSYDTEPKKNVVATAYKEKCWLPSVTLTALIQRELHPKAPTPIPHVHDEEALRKSASAAKQSTSLLPGQSTKPVAWASRETTHTVLKKNTKAEKQIDYFDFSVD